MTNRSEGTLLTPDWLEHWPDGLIALTHDFKIAWLSVKAQEYLGFSDEVMGQSAHVVLCPALRGAVHNEMACPWCAAAIDSNQHHSSWWHTVWGQYISVDYRVLEITTPNALQRIISFYDNQSRDHSFREMLKLTEYVDQSPMPIAEFDAEAQMMFGNAAMQQALLNYGFDDVGQARIIPQNFADICRQVVALRAITSTEMSINEHWYRWHVHPVADEMSETVVAFLFDITEQRQAETKLLDDQRAARRDFYAKMVHELRTPLNAIVGFSQLLLKRTALSLGERDLSSLKAIRMAGLQLNELISDTLDAAKIEAGKMTLQWETFAVARVFESFHDQIHYLAEGKNLVYRVICDVPFEVQSDFKKLRQILLNLLGNAIKYTSQGEVTLTAYIEQEIWVVFDVNDTGIGIPEDQQVQLFQAYQQVESHKSKDIQGTGLGLTLVAEMVALLGGSIRLSSRVGEGSQFRIKLPKSPLKS